LLTKNVNNLERITHSPSFYNKGERTINESNPRIIISQLPQESEPTHLYLSQTKYE